MASEYYKKLFKFLNLICVLSIDFDGQKFTAPKSLRIKSVILLSSVQIIKKILNASAERKEIEGGDLLLKNISKAFLFFVFFITGIIKFVPFLCTSILLFQQKQIAKIFSKFYELQKLCDSKNIETDEKVILRKTKKSILIFLSIIILSFDYIDLTLKKQIGLVEIVESIITHISTTHYLLCLNFCSLILIHFEFLINNVNQILDNQFELVHDNCENLLEWLSLIKKLFTSLNQTFGVIFTIETLNELFGTVGFVSNLCIYLRQTIFIFLFSRHMRQYH